MKKQLADFVFTYFKQSITIFVFLSVLLNFLMILEHSDVCRNYKHQIADLKSELKVKTKQIDGLHEQVSRQTKRIADLTGNGG